MQGVALRGLLQQDQPSLDRVAGAVDIWLRQNNGEVPDERNNLCGGMLRRDVCHAIPPSDHNGLRRLGSGVRSIRTVAQGLGVKRKYATKNRSQACATITGPLAWPDANFRMHPHLAAGHSRVISFAQWIRRRTASYQRDNRRARRLATGGGQLRTPGPALIPGARDRVRTRQSSCRRWSRYSRRMGRP
jgi:hypothetical protein